MVAEAVSTDTFRVALEALDEGKQLEVDWAIYALEEDPSWDGEMRLLAPADSPFTGYLVDLSVDDHWIVYRVADKGAVIELWYLLEVPGSKVRRPRPEGPPPMM